jgi:hypothetical protein
VRLTIYDLRGQRVRELASPRLAAGRHELPWDGRDARGLAQPSGIYFYELLGAAWRARGRMTLVR